ncbi:hypothetical protein O6H91_21G048800 [Diphasiastrum complanatum]|uniref:Uncharacterized protein n=1 Tax=Diphasiastrum complanatum TaxID=34168 RepID=A0ACC2AK96_DIPCM|nr:hypothetical protein O6H91_21G048800 [Diphasiastrum complanatum]
MAAFEKLTKQLPIVGSDILEGGWKRWPQTAKWLQGLDAVQVEHWFESNKCSHRLGDHFAKCVEYVLRFSPGIQVDRLFYSQQVLKDVKKDCPACCGCHQGHDEASSLLCEDGLCFYKIQGDSEPSPEKDFEMQNCSEKFTHVVRTRIYIKDEGCKLDFHIQPASCCGYNKTFPQYTDMDVAQLMPKTQSEVGNGGDEAHDIPFKQTKYEKELLVQRIRKQKKKKLQKQERQMLGKGIRNTVGEFDFLFQTTRQDACGTLQTMNFKDPAKFKINNLSTDPSSGSPSTNLIETMVHHWEVSVKFLLYVGPWEAFGLPTPDYAWWSLKSLKLESSGSNQGNSHLYCCSEHYNYGKGYHACLSDSDFHNYNILRRCREHTLWGEEEFMGCFLGPHAGETLADRKNRLKKQIFLSSNPSAASVVFKLFGNGHRGSPGSAGNTRLHCALQEAGSTDCHNFKNLDQAEVDEQFRRDADGQDNKVLKVLPRALLRGYLFYEYQLWHFLSAHCCSLGLENLPDVQSHEKLNEQDNGSLLNRDLVCWESSFCKDQGNATCFLDLENDSEHHTDVLKNNMLKRLSMNDKCKKAHLNPEQWIGWWIHVGDFSEFANHPIHGRSLWYIVPKHEWLSPVMITAHGDGCEALLTVENFLMIAKTVAKEATEKDIPRKRRFMVAEVCWNQEIVDENIDTSVDVIRSGEWFEVSRGFVVEDTWPDSKAYAPHGFVTSWSPNLKNSCQNYHNLHDAKEAFF